MRSIIGRSAAALSAVAAAVAAVAAVLLMAAAGCRDVGTPTVSRGVEEITPPQPASLYSGILTAYRAGEKRVVVPPGVYRLWPDDYGGRFRLDGLHDFTIDAAGATFLWADPAAAGITFDHCRHVTLRGATLQNAIPPFTQGRIVAIAADGRSYDVRIDAGYPANLDDPAYFPPRPVGYVFAPGSRQWREGTFDLYADAAVERQGDGLFRLHWDRPAGPDRMPVAVGDAIAFRGNIVEDIRLADCARMRVEGVTIRSGGGFCVHEDGGDGGSVYAFRVTYGPPPPGATAEPRIASNADAFHSSGVRRGPTVERCSFEGMPDDGIAIHGRYAWIESVAGARLQIGCLGEPPFRTGDTVRIYDPQGRFAGRATVRAAAQSGAAVSAKASVWYPFRQRPLSQVALTLDRTVPAGFDSVIADVDACGAGYVVRRNVIRNHRARGLLLKADHGLVEDNVIDGSTMAGIVVAPELYYWAEADYSHGVTIRRNTIRNTGYATTGPDNDQAAGLTVTGEGALGHRGIVIEDNIFQGIRGANLVIHDARDVIIRGNRFLATHARPSQNGANRGIDPTAVIWLGDCQEVHLAGNTIDGLGPYGRSPLALSPHAQDVTGTSGGIRITPPGH